ncbi:MAG: hypothetical protein KA764_12125 [Anaerolineales bacterium]|nr:hypothetical protein [Anaerolineales bacterium]
MTIKRSLAGLLVYLAFFYNVERLDFGQQNIVDLNTFIYVLVLAAIVSQVVFQPIARMKIGSQIILGLGIYIVGRLVLWAFFAKAIFGGLETYVFITEIALLALGLVLGRRVAQDYLDFEDAVENLSLSGHNRKARTLETATEDIQLELSRSRRHHYPLSVIVVQSDPNSLKEVIHRTVQEVQRAMMGRYVLAGLGRALGRHLRRTDILVDQLEKGRYVIVSPDTDTERARLLIDRLQTLVAGRLGVRVSCGIASFPDEALTFDELVHAAEAGLHPAAPALKDVSSEVIHQ